MGELQFQLLHLLWQVEAALPVAPDAAQRRRIADVAMELDAFEMLELSAIGTLPAGAAPGPLSSVLKLRASRLKQGVAALGVELLGAAALRRPGGTRGDVLVTDYLNSRAATIFGGTAEVQLGIIAKSFAGI